MTERRVGVAFQEPRLFPNLSVVDNVAYGLKMDRVAKQARRARAMELLGAVGLADRSRDRPRGLSGGEQQRVALARALCGDRSLLLLDEPLSAVDGPARTSLRGLLRDLKERTATTTVVVTHDLADATALGEVIAVMGDGRVLQCDRPDVVFDRPVDPAVAALTGNPNLLDGRVRRGVLELGTLGLPLDAPDGDLRWTVRPERIRLGTGRGEPARVVSVERRADRASVRLVGVFGELEADVAAPDAPVPGEMVCVDVDPRSIWIFPDAPASSVGGAEPLRAVVGGDLR